MFFFKSIIMVALFAVGFNFSYLIWALPYYRIKQMKGMSLKEKGILNLLTITLIVVLFKSKDILFFIGIYALFEGLYEVLNRKFNKIGIFDKIFIISLIVGGLVSIVIYLNYDIIINTYLNLYTELLNKLKIDGISGENLLVLNNIKNYFVENRDILKNYCIFGTIFTFTVNSFFMYYALYKKSFKNWKVSYIWLVPYIVLFFLAKYVIKDSIIIKNILESLKLIYIMYFCKIVYRLINSTLKKDILSLLISLIVTFNMPWLAFAIGGIASGIDIRVRVIKE